MLKAYKVFPGEIPSDFGCLLVFAESNSKARSTGYKGWPGSDSEYLDFRAWRQKGFDRYSSELDKPACFETNDDLPDDWERFFDDEVY